MVKRDGERPPAAVEAARILAAAENRSVVGIGEYFAFYGHQIDSEEYQEETILVCEVQSFDECSSSDRLAAHSKRLFEVDQADAEPDAASSTELAV